MRLLARLAPLGLAALLSSAAAAEPRPEPPRTVAKGDVLTVDLSRVPSRLERKGNATCAGHVLDATGKSKEVRCDRPFRFDGPLLADPIVLVFTAKDGGKTTRLEYPVERDARLKTWTVPAAGTLAPPAPDKAGKPGKAAEPPAPPKALLDLARAAATATCGECRGAAGFALKDFTIEAAPPAAIDARVSVQPAPK